MRNGSARVRISRPRSKLIDGGGGADREEDHQMKPSCIKCGADVTGKAHYMFHTVNGDGSYARHRWALCVNCGLDVRVFIGEHPPINDDEAPMAAGRTATRTTT
jgi:hypothetical protein